MKPRLQARPIYPCEKEKYREHLDRFHYLRSPKTHLNRALDYVVEDHKGEWLALVSWGYAALKNGARDKWIGWNEELKNKRLRYVVTNTRFLVLPWAFGRKNLASQSLSLVLKRLSLDWAKYYGHHALLAETFVNKAKFKGTCYQAANWNYVGDTKGYGRNKGSYFEHNDKKAVYLYPLHRNTKKILSSKDFPHPFLITEQGGSKVMIDVNKLPLAGKGGLFDMLSEVPDKRQAQGKRYKHTSLLALAVCATLSGANSVRAMRKYAKYLSFEAREKLGFRRFNVPTEPTIGGFLNSIDATLFDSLVSEWLFKNGIKTKGKAIAVDGKTVKASRNSRGKPVQLLSAVLHHDGIVLNQRKIADKTNEIPELRPLLDGIPLKGTVVTVDALHTQKDTARYLTEERHADYLMTVKGNQLELFKQITSLPPEAFSPSVHSNRKSSRKD